MADINGPNPKEKFLRCQTCDYDVCFICADKKAKELSVVKAMA